MEGQALIAPSADAHKVFRTKLKGRGGQRRHQPLIVQRVIQHMQQGQHVRYLNEVKKLLIGVRIDGDALVAQHAGDGFGPAGGAAQQHHHVPPGKLSADALFLDHTAAKIGHQPGHQGRLAGAGAGDLL